MLAISKHKPQRRLTAQLSSIQVPAPFYPPSCGVTPYGFSLNFPWVLDVTNLANSNAKITLTTNIVGTGWCSGLGYFCPAGGAVPSNPQPIWPDSVTGPTAADSWFWIWQAEMKNTPYGTPDFYGCDPENDVWAQPVFISAYTCNGSFGQNCCHIDP